jgi:hypothetical protein
MTSSHLVCMQIQRWQNRSIRPTLILRGATRSEVETAGVIRRRWVRIPSWLEADPSLHREAVYIEADRFFHQKILLAIGRRTIHSDPSIPRSHP